jgi:hypothetical protein
MLDGHHCTYPIVDIVSIGAVVVVLSRVMRLCCVTQASQAQLGPSIHATAKMRVCNVSSAGAVV